MNQYWGQSALHISQAAGSKLNVQFVIGTCILAAAAPVLSLLAFSCRPFITHTIAIYKTVVNDALLLPTK